MIMHKRNYWVAMSGALVGLIMVCGVLSVGAQTLQPSKAKAGGEPAKTMRQRFMEGKLVVSQEILQGVVLSDFKLIEKGAIGMNLLTTAEEWGFSNSKEYGRMSEDLRRISKQLVKAAQDKNGEAATLAYQRLTLNCVECHQALREGLK